MDDLDDLSRFNCPECNGTGRRFLRGDPVLGSICEACKGTAANLSIEPPDDGRPDSAKYGYTRAVYDSLNEKQRALWDVVPDTPEKALACLRALGMVSMGVDEAGTKELVELAWTTLGLNADWRYHPDMGFEVYVVPIFET